MKYHFQIKIGLLTFYICILVTSQSDRYIFRTSVYFVRLCLAGSFIFIFSFLHMRHTQNDFSSTIFERIIASRLFSPNWSRLVTRRYAAISCLFMCNDKPVVTLQPYTWLLTNPPNRYRVAQFCGGGFRIARFYGFQANCLHGTSELSLQLVTIVIHEIYLLLDTAALRDITKHAFSTERRSLAYYISSIKRCIKRTTFYYDLYNAGYWQRNISKYPRVNSE